MDNQNIGQEFEEAHQNYVKTIFRFAYFKVSEREAALDITQDTFLKFWKTLSSGQPIKNTKAFLFLIAHGLIIDFYRRRNHRTYVPLDQAEGLVFAADDDTDNKIDKQKELDRVLSKIHELKEAYCDVLLLYYIEDIAVQDIAAILGKNENSTRVLIHRALKELKRKL